MMPAPFSGARLPSEFVHQGFEFIHIFKAAVDTGKPDVSHFVEFFSSRMTNSPMRLEATSRCDKVSNLSSMRSMAASICSVLTGRFRRAKLREPRNLLRS